MSKSIQLFRADISGDFQGIFGSEKEADFSHISENYEITPFTISEEKLLGFEIQIDSQIYDFEKGMDLSKATILDDNLSLWEIGVI